MGRGARSVEGVVTAYVVELAPRAESDIGDGFLLYRERKALAADAFRTAVFDAIERIAAAPFAAAADERGTPKRGLRRVPYTVFFEALESKVIVLAVAYHRRKPGYRRMGER